MHYNTRSFKLHQFGPILQLSADEFLQLRANLGWHLHLMATEAPGDVDGLLVRPQELDTGRAIAEMFVEAALYVRVERALHIFEQQPLDIATPEHRSNKLLKWIHYKFDAWHRGTIRVE